MTRAVPALLLLGALLLAGVGVDVLTAPPAAAHATIVSTSPADGARLDAVPDAVTLQFDEPVSLGAGYARVLGADGERADTGAAEVGDDTVTVPLRDGLPESGYLVTYRVVSADSHPVSGAFSFVVGDGELLAVDAAITDADVHPVVAAALPAARWLGYLGLALGVGIPLTLAVCWPGGWAVPLLRRLTLAGLGAVAVGALLGVLLQGPYAAGAGPGSLLDPDLLGATLGSTYGLTLLARLLLAAALAGLLAAGWRAGRPPARGLLVGAGVLAAVLVVAVAAVGHPVAGPLPGLAVPVAAVHAAAMAGWLGGLTALFAGALRRREDAAERVGELALALPRWSRLAAGLIAALVVTGVLQSVREVGTLSALLTTTYGWLLVVKLVLVLGVLVAALVSRDWVQQRLGDRRRDRVATAGSPAEHLGVLRRSVLLELAGAAAVLALSAALVGTPPARAAVADPVEVTLPLQSATGTDGTVQVTLAPASPGPASLHVYLYDDAGTLIQPQQITVSLTEPQQEIGPLDVELAGAGPGHYIGDPVLPTAGTWTLTVTVRLDEFTARTASTTFPVR
ncbi:copper resistance CopC/CopD family protein [Modestobacter roseus]|uniref:Copper transport protein n=1 Tax=Modestobacter roseus TaxID=1181884 RepID=A0A562ILQ9_9ACTN|nr:copper resistance protein CopC [Modestobacter roseus]MQA32333.1 copper resistance protein CopC [Modestobacter roseus]TWH71828.1 copper transport protein [Modestobacter roseus]